MKIYKSDRAGKREFVREVISPLTIQTRSGMRYEGNESVEDKTFKEAEIAVKSYAFSVVEEYGETDPDASRAQ